MTCMECDEMNTAESIIANELALLETLKTVVKLSHGNEEVILEEIEKIKNELKKGQRSNR